MILKTPGHKLAASVTRFVYRIMMYPHRAAKGCIRITTRRIRKNPMLTRPRSFRRISVAFLTCTTMLASRPLDRVPHSVSRLLDRVCGSYALIDPFIGVNVEDDGEPLSPARTIINVGANAYKTLSITGDSEKDDDNAR